MTLKKLEQCPICQKETKFVPIMISGRPQYKCPECSSTMDVSTIWQIVEEEEREKKQTP